MEIAASARSMAGWQPGLEPARAAPRQSSSNARCWHPEAYKVYSASDANQAGVRTEPGRARNEPADHWRAAHRRRRCIRRAPARKRPASVSLLLCSPAPARRRGRSDVTVNEFLQAQVLGEGGRHWPPGGGRQRRCGYGRDCSVAASNGCSLFPGGFLLQNHCHRFRGAPSGFFEGCLQGRRPVDSDLKSIGDFSAIKGILRIDAVRRR